VTGEMRATRDALPKPRTIRYVALEEQSALAVTKLIEWAPLAEKVIEAARLLLDAQWEYVEPLYRITLHEALAALDAAKGETTA
jgi:hypothetical protein